MRNVTILSFTLLATSTALAQPGFESGPPAPPEAQPPQPQQPAQPPAGSTHAQFLSTTSEPWTVSIDRAMVCTTPCALWVPPAHFIALHSQERNPVRLDVGYLGGGDVVVAGKPLEEGKYATGIVFTTLGGMALVTGITLAAVGYSTDHGGMCTAGAITGLTGAFVTAGSIWLMKSALPEAHIGPASPYIAGSSAGVAGTF